MKPYRETYLVAHPSAELYGSDRVLLETVEGLVSTGARIVVTVPSHGPLVFEILARRAEVTIRPSTVLQKKMLTPHGMARLLWDGVASFRSTLEQLREYRPSVVYVNTVTIPLWPIVARLAGCKVVVHVHEADGANSRAIRFAMTLPLLFASLVVANSEYTTEVLRRSLKAVVARTRVVYNGVPGPTNWSEPREHLDGTFRLLYFGRLSHRKGVDVAVDALAELSRRGIKATLDIVGAVYPGNETYESDLRTLVSDYGLEGEIRFHGFQGNVWPYLEGADAAVIPSRLEESFGNTAVEALLAARPIIVSDNSGLREAAGGYTSVQFVRPGSPAEVRVAVEHLIQAWPHWRKRAIDDRRTAHRKHNPLLYQQDVAAIVRGFASPVPIDHVR
ncbi:glycosyltransferase [Arthrobacter sp. Br18]|uniref:glycosyltransferase n=1 Tax=Arthrobacter sp. Br18 TaxID=1312954 RepID=UPI00047D204A|nr:glycosyltransferase [Arthrobacter sp. Br18]